nr:hypothetical protein CFP56_16555 [Quercus suber]
MGKLTNQFFDNRTAYKEKGRQRMYLKDIDCPDVWREKIREQVPSTLFYFNESTGEVGGPGAVLESNGKRTGKGIARAGDLMSSLPPEMRAENLMCYIGHEGTYTPAHREMCASLGQNIMVEASTGVSDDGKPEKPGSSIWFMTESKDRHIVSEYWLSVLGHDIEVEDHFAQIVAWKKAPFNVYVVQQDPGDFILIPPLAPHQVWNRGTRTMKVAWNRTTVETLEMALNEALPRSRIVCRDEQYKNKAIIYYTLQKYSGLLALAQQQAAGLSDDGARQLLYSRKIKQLLKDFKRLFKLYRQILLSEMFNPEDTPKSIEYLPFDSNVTCAYCRGNVFNRFLSCPSCKDLLGHNDNDGDGDPYDVCTDCYAMGRSCACVSGLKWVEQFRWKELASKYETWRNLIVACENGRVTDDTPLPLTEEKLRYGKKTLAEVCKLQLKRRPFKDVSKPREKPDDDDDEEIVVGDDGMVKKTKKKKPKNWHKTHTPCHVCKKGEENWKLAFCTTCDKAWCYGSLFRGWDKMPIDIMEDPNWSCPHCLGICFAGTCRKDERMIPYEPKGTLLGHDTKKVADARSVEALVDFSFSNLSWLKDNEAVDRTESSRIRRAQEEAQRDKAVAEGEPEDENDEHHEVEQSQIDHEYAPPEESAIDPALREDEIEDASLISRLQQANALTESPTQNNIIRETDGVPDGYTSVKDAGYVPPTAQMYPQLDGESPYPYPGLTRAQSVEQTDGRGNGEVHGLRPFIKRVHQGAIDENDDLLMAKHPKAKKPKLAAAGFRSSDLAEGSNSKAKSMAQRQFEQEKERKALDKAKAEGRFIIMSAALRGKKRIVQLNIPGARLAQILARQAAKFADPPSDEDAPSGIAQATELEEPMETLLQSDLAPKKSTENLYNQRREEGYIITASTKKALIPMERDGNYNTHGRNLPRKAINGRPEKRRSRLAVEYEEVDVGSDDEDVDDSFVGAANAAPASGRRTQPGYRQNRGDNEQAEPPFPDELPESFRDRNPVAPRVRASSSKSAASPVSRNGVGRFAGKRPMMRPRNTTADDDTEDNNVVNAISMTSNDDPIPVDEQQASHAVKLRDGKSRSSLQASSNDETSPEQSCGRPPKSASINNKRAIIDEENRLAKLQVLELMDDAYDKTSGGHAAGLNDELSSDNADSDNEPDNIPARNPTVAPV